MPNSSGRRPWIPEKKDFLKVTWMKKQESEIDLTFTTLMGDKVEPRREFIEENAKFVKNKTDIWKAFNHGSETESIKWRDKPNF